MPRRRRLINSHRPIIIGRHVFARYLAAALVIILYVSSTSLTVFCDAFAVSSSIPGKTGAISSRHIPIGKTTTSHFLSTSNNASNNNSNKNDGEVRKKQTKSPKKQQTASSSSTSTNAAPPVFLFPWSFWLKLRHQGKSYYERAKNSKSKRWDVPLTSKPFQGVDELQSTVVNCLLAITIYFSIGTVIPFMLEPSWTFIDALYFSMTTLTTIGYGDLVVGSSGVGLRATIAKLFLISFNIYAVCISVSALGIIAKIAMAQEKKILRKARERARDRFVKLWSVDDDDDDEEEDDEDLAEEDEEGEDCNWMDNIFLDKCDSDKRRTLMGTLWQSIQRHSTNFVALIGIALMLVRVEKWSLIDILYYWNSTATTIGFGDVAPKTQIGRLLAVIFIPLSVISLGEVIAGCFAHLNARAAAKAEKDFLRREVTFNDLEYLDVNDDGKVCMLDFITFMLLAMQKVDKKTMKDLKSLFNALDTQSSGFIEKEDLILLRQRKRLAKRLRREARNRKKLFDRGYPKGVNEDLQTTKHIYDQLHGYKITSSNS